MNPHALRHKNLNLACLPISPHPLNETFSLHSNFAWVYPLFDGQSKPIYHAPLHIVIRLCRPRSADPQAIGPASSGFRTRREASISSKFTQALEKFTADRRISELAVCLHDARTNEQFSGFSGHLDGQPVGPDTPYFLASATKLFVTALILQLVEEDALDLNAPVSEFFPPRHLNGLHVLKGTDHTPHITIEHLLSHTSGLPDYFEQKQKDGTVFAKSIIEGRDVSFDLDDVLTMARSNMKPRFAPDGRRAHYSDTNFQLLGAIIENVLQTSFANAVDQRIARPLKLKNTFVFEADGPRSNIKVLPLRNGDKTLHVPNAMTGVGPDGGIVSSAADGLTFIRAFFEGTLFSTQRIQHITRTWRPVFFPLHYGTGIMLFRLPRFLTPFRKQPDLIGHSGISGAFLFAEPENRIYISGTVNQLSARSLPYAVMLQAIAAIR